MPLRISVRPCAPALQILVFLNAALCSPSFPGLSAAAQTVDGAAATDPAQSGNGPGSDQAGTAVRVRGTVVDPSGALVPGARIRFHAAETSPATSEQGRLNVESRTDGSGQFSASLQPGRYSVSIAAEGFQTLNRALVVVHKIAPLSFQLAVSAAETQVDVGANDAGSTSNQDNKSALVFRGDQLDTFSSNDSMMQQQIMAMAGGSGDGGGQIYVNGFSGGKFPPKDTIREIRINQNPFSSQYEDLGYGRVEIFTKPGSNKLHGNIFSSGSDQSFNSLNPYTGAEPPYFLLFNQGDVNGPLGKKTSFFLSGERSDIHNNAVVNAFNPDGSRLSEAVSAPQTEHTVSARIDRQLGASNTLIVRYEDSSNQVSNSGVGLLVLPSEGTTNTTGTQTLQVGNTELIGTKIVSESRFQYLRTRLVQTPNSTAPSISVQGAFNGGGSPSQGASDSQDQFEFQEYLSFTLGDHFLRLGARYRLAHEVNVSTANFNGQYTFASLSAYGAGTPNLFNLTLGNPRAELLTGDVGAYAEDEWKVRRSVTATFGLRLESQSAVPDHVNPAPRAGVSWAIGQTDKHAPLVVLRAAAGIFYQRFAAANLLTSVRQNGVSEQEFLVTNPTFYPAIPNAAALSGTAPTPYRVDPALKIASQNIASLSAERAVGKLGSVTLTYYAVRGVHQYNSFNANAPLVSGQRPLGGTADLYQFASQGVMKAQALSVNSNLHFGKRGSLFGFYSARVQHNDVFGATSFPSQPYDVSADYGPSGLGFQPVAQRLFVGGEVTLPAGFRLDMFNATFSRTRFNITTGTDRNGDTQFNDRPAFATAPGPTSQIYMTAFGVFDANPQPDEAVVPYNYGLGPRMDFVAANLSRIFQFGPRGEAPPPAPGGVKPGGKAPAGDPRYWLRFGVDVANVLNTNNAGVPVGVLTSPYFGQSISSSSFFGLLSAANRVAFLSTSFQF